MAAQYSNRHFFRKTPNHFLALFFETKGIQLDVDFSQLKENDADRLQTALNTLTGSQTADAEVVPIWGVSSKYEQISRIV